MTDNVASTAEKMGLAMEEMREMLNELGKHYRLLFIGQILLYALLILSVLKGL